jgi:hypothetical protein
MRPASFFVLTVAAVALATPALAQTPSINMAPQDKQYTSDELEKQKEIDRAYREAIKKLPDQQGNKDPWGLVRGVDQSAPKSAAPKAAKPAAPKNAGVRTQPVRIHTAQ